VGKSIGCVDSRVARSGDYETPVLGDLVMLMGVLGMVRGLGRVAVASAVPPTPITSIIVSIIYANRVVGGSCCVSS
jgi:hypothetical protein